MCFRQDAEFQFFTDLAVGDQVFDGIARGKTDRVDARRIAEYAITHYRKIALYLPAEKELCQLRTWLILRAHLAKQRVAKLVLLEKLDYKEKFADVSIQRSMLQEEIVYAEAHMKTIEREMQELIAADSNICRNYKLLKHQRSRSDHGHCDALFDAQFHQNNRLSQVFLLLRAGSVRT